MINIVCSSIHVFTVMVVLSKSCTGTNHPVSLSATEVEGRDYLHLVFAHDEDGEEMMSVCERVQPPSLCHMIEVEGAGAREGTAPRFVIDMSDVS